MSRWKTRVVWIAGVIAVAGMLVGSAMAAGLASPQAQEEFVKRTDITTEGLPASPLLYTAYALVWLVLIFYLFLLWRRVAKVERELQDVSARLASSRRS